MQHFILRCKHCNKEYTYCTYGNGPEYGTEAGCSMDYCAECQTAINQALGKIKKKFEPRQMEIKEPRLIELFDKLRTEDKIRKGKVEQTGLGNFPCVCGCCGEKSNYDVIEEYRHNGKRYYLKWMDKKPGKKHIFIDMEYDFEKREFTKHPWKYNEDREYYIQYRNTAKDLVKSLKKLNKVKPLPMDEPISMLSFIDFNWDVETKHGDYVPSKKEHILRQHTSGKIEGWKIKHDVKNGWYQTSVKLAKDVSLKGIIDYLDYQYTYEQYDDENVATIINVECV